MDIKKDDLNFSGGLGENKKIGIIGLGYVGLPLAIEFGKTREVVGYDIKESRINELKNNTDLTLEISEEDFKDSIHLNFTSHIEDLNDCQIFIVTVPTPIDEYKKPDLNPLIKSSQAVGSILKKGDIVIYESTVYPGTTEEVCVPELEKNSGLILIKIFIVAIPQNELILVIRNTQLLISKKFIWLKS